MENELFEIRETKKGRGLFARKDLPRGTLILTERVVAVHFPEVERIDDWIDPDFWKKLSASEDNSRDIEKMVHNYISGKTQDEKSIISKLASTISGFHHLASTFLTNRLRLTSGCNIFGLGVHFSLLNHACIPNACVSSGEYDDTQGRATVWIKSAKEIKAGQEISVSYVNLNIARKERRALTRKLFEFSCICTTCKKPDPAKEQLMEQFGHAFNRLLVHHVNFAGHSRPWEFFRNAGETLRLLGEIGIVDGRVAHVWELCAYVACYHSDAVRAQHFFQRAAEFYKVIESTGSCNLQTRTALAADPSSDTHWGRTSLGYSKTSYHFVPKDETHALARLFMTDYDAPEYHRLVTGPDNGLTSVTTQGLAKLEHARMEAAVAASEAQAKALIAEVEQGAAAQDKVGAKKKSRSEPKKSKKSKKAKGKAKQEPEAELRKERGRSSDVEDTDGGKNDDGGSEVTIASNASDQRAHGESPNAESPVNSVAPEERENGGSIMRNGKDFFLELREQMTALLAGSGN